MIFDGICNEQNELWCQRRFQGRRSRKSKCKGPYRVSSKKNGNTQMPSLSFLKFTVGLKPDMLDGRARCR